MKIIKSIITIVAMLTMFEKVLANDKNYSFTCINEESKIEGLLMPSGNKKTSEEKVLIAASACCSWGDIPFCNPGC